MNMNFQNSGYQTSNLNGNEATLIVYAPQNIPDQILRPYVYRFDGAVVDDIIHYADEKAIYGKSTIFDKENLLTSIVPEVNGVRMDNVGMSNYWTFVLMIDAKAPEMSGLIGSVATRAIACGYIDREPFAPATLHSSNPIHNPNAILRFTHKTSISKLPGSTISRGSIRPSIAVNQDADNVGMYLGQHCEDDLYIATPADVRSSMMNSVAVDLAKSSIANMAQKDASISTVLKSPSHHLNELTNSVGDVLSLKGTVDDQISSDLDIAPMVQDSTLEMAFDRSLIGRDFGGPINSLDFNSPLQLSTLFSMFPNINVLPVELNSSPWDVKPQSMVSHDVVMSSMIANTISSISVSIGICNIDFAYSSYNPLDNMTGRGRWEIMTVSPIVTRTDELLKADTKRFMHLLESQLFPILKVSGDFDMVVHFDMAGSTLVDFKYLDDSNQTRGFIEIPNRFGSFVSPVIGNTATYTSNAQNLNALFNTVMPAATEDVGPSMMDLYNEEVMIDNSIQMNNPQRFPEMLGFLPDSPNLEDANNGYAKATAF